MINKLIPEQISSMWPVIKFAVEQSLPPIVGEHPDKMNRILSSMLCGDLEVWAVYDKEDRKFEAIMVTRLMEDVPSGTKSLLIYCLYGYSGIPNERYVEGHEVLSKYAKSKGCSRVMAYTNEPRLIELAKSIGASFYTFLSFEIDR